MRGVLDLRLVGSFLLTICLSLGRYFSSTQSCASQDRIQRGPLEGPEPVCLSKFVTCPTRPLETGSLGGPF